MEKGTVMAVLSGDTFLFKLGRQSSCQYSVIRLPIACAPNISIFKKNGKHDPFALESLECLRSLIERKSVVIGANFNRSSSCTFTHQFLGRIPVSVREIKSVNGTAMNIDEIMITNGYARIHPEAICNRDHYQQLETQAQTNRVGIWGAPRKPINPMTVVEFQSVVVAVNSDFTLRLLEPPMDVELAGVTDCSSDEFQKFAGENLLFRKVYVRVLRRFIDCPFIVSMMTDDGYDVAKLMIDKKYAQVNPITSRFADSLTDAVNDIPMVFNGIVKSIPNSGMVEVRVGSRSIRVKLDSIQPRAFNFQKQEPFGLAAWKFLRDRVLGCKVDVEIQRKDRYEQFYWGQISVKGENVNEAMVKAGLAIPAISRVQPAHNWQTLIAADASAKESRAGIHGPVVTPNSDTGIILSILSPTELLIWLPNSTVERKILDSVRFIGHDYCRCMRTIEFLSGYIHRDVKIQGNAIILSETEKDLRVGLIEGGFLELSDGCTVDVLQKAAKNAPKPVVGYELNTKSPYMVTNVLSPTQILVQCQCDEMQFIHDILDKHNGSTVNKDDLREQNLYVIKVNGRKYRMMFQNDKCLLIDYGFRVDPSLGPISPCPADITYIPPQCFAVKLAHVKQFDDASFNRDVVKYLWNIFDSGVLFQMKIVKRDAIPHVLLCDIPDGGVLQTVMVKDGSVQVDPTLLEKCPCDDDLKKLEQRAKQERVGGWQ